MRNRNSKGFTLVELLVAIAIIGIIAVVAVPALFKNIAKSKIADLEGDISAIKSAVLLDYAENGELNRGFGDLDKIENYMEGIDEISPIGGRYYIEVEGKNENRGENLPFGGYKIDKNGNLSEYKYVKDDYKMALLLRAEKWDNNIPIDQPKITLKQLEKLARDIGYERVYISGKEFSEKGNEIYIGLISQ
ncbi:type II secretion system protein [[Clostridium] dakarense]|uniref:type II secretion system protein n=1 Tax=Faecalimicrobium dakarense TaxID=1301100 RepID=UPI0004BB5972|nr:prepilin-type N-terminal cleavage/methylation domain-containing protein [[Clostridium] dakarense]